MAIQLRPQYVVICDTEILKKANKRYPEMDEIHFVSEKLWTIHFSGT